MPIIAIWGKYFFFGTIKEKFGLLDPKWNKKSTKSRFLNFFTVILGLFRNF